MAAYQVLYRKYRPRFFADVIDQPQVTVTLKNELTRGRIAHAYLFTGSRGTGKTTCAKILARAVNCLNPRDGDPCGECEICRGIEDGSILDVMEIDAASNNGVENVRSLIEEARFTPATAKYRVYIIDEAHMITDAAFNALLKTLEEPPAHVIFILATTEVHKLLPTILSRCQRFDFKRISPAAIADRLDYVCQREGAQLDREAGLLIARVADGAMRDALSLLDQCLGRDTHVTLALVNDAAGLAGREYLAALAGAVAAGDLAGALSTLDGLYRDAKDMTRLCRELAEYFRGLMLIKTMRDASDLVPVSPEEWEVMTRQALGMELSAILHGLDVWADALDKMRYADQRTQLEMALARLCTPQLDDSPAALLRRIEALERGAPRLSPAPAVDVGEKAAPAVESGEGPAPAPEKADPVPAGREAPAEPEGAPPEEPGEAEPSPPPEDPLPFDRAPTPPEAPARREAPSKAPPAAPPQERPVDIQALSAAAQRFRDWPEILQIIRGATKSVAMAFSGSNAYVSGEYMLIEAPEIAFELLKRPEQRQRMREAIRQVTGRVYKLGPYRPPAGDEAADPLEDLARRARESGIGWEESADGEAPDGDPPREG